MFTLVTRDKRCFDRDKHVAEGQRSLTAWEIVDWLKKRYPQAGIELAGELMNEHMESPKTIIAREVIDGH